MIIVIFAFDKTFSVMINPFVTTGYVGPEYFCDRDSETKALTDLLCNGNNVALMSPRRYGKTDLIRHCFAQEEISRNYYTFIIDIYSTKSLSEMTERMGKTILDVLKPKGKKVWSKFVDTLSSLKGGISYDAAGVPSWTLQIGDIHNPGTTLDEIFSYLRSADKPCLVAIDEFQQIEKYGDRNVEATLRTYIQYCPNAHFVFSGSQREMMGAIFTSPARPFYQSASIINLPPIREELYAEFCRGHFSAAGKSVDDGVVPVLYRMFDGTTFYLQKMMNVLFMFTGAGETCRTEMVEKALDYILDFSAATYEDLLYQLPEKQKQVLLAIASEGRATALTSGNFVGKYSLQSASSVNSAVKGLLEKGMVTHSRGVYQVYDLFFREWIVRRYLG